ncbi:hypothetical protein [Chitinimonas koreensis]|uniref:hypothetical protein n=1 Tax=Chitinimonas koreensis TaxID=356302 RepID=UPI0012FCA6F3|nr:hypothetical protein [Chitinimonas koreensis]QNM95269.1 hypothetical protein H9L41_15470 [Chitinimonas koreensis]
MMVNIPAIWQAKSIWHKLFAMIVILGMIFAWNFHQRSQHEYRIKEALRAFAHSNEQEMDLFSQNVNAERVCIQHAYEDKDTLEKKMQGELSMLEYIYYTPDSEGKYNLIFLRRGRVLNIVSLSKSKDMEWTPLKLIKEFCSNSGRLFINQTNGRKTFSFEQERKS